MSRAAALACLQRGWSKWLVDDSAIDRRLQQRAATAAKLGNLASVSRARLWGCEDELGHHIDNPYVALLCGTGAGPITGA